MVYCVKCGTKNPDDAKVCSKCGAPLYAAGEEAQERRTERECFGTRMGREPRRRVEEECFGIPKGGAVVGLAIGIIILLAGCIWLMQQAGVIPTTVQAWPFAVIIFGILIIIGALYGFRRRL
jgi:uncharacterized membrane protein YvbJ